MRKIFALLLCTFMSERCLSELIGLRSKRTRMYNREVETTDLLLNYMCGGNNVLLFQQKDLNCVTLYCGLVTMSNEDRYTAVPCSGKCFGKSSYLQGIVETIPNGGMTGWCLQFSPVVLASGDDKCQIVSVKDVRPRLHLQNDVPDSEKSPLTSYRGRNRGDSVRQSWQIKMKAKIKLDFFPPYGSVLRLVKGIQKTVDGYEINYCTVQCDHTKTTITTVTPHCLAAKYQQGKQKLNENAFQLPPQVDDEGGSDNREIRSNHQKTTNNRKGRSSSTNDNEESNITSSGSVNGRSDTKVKHGRHQEKQHRRSKHIRRKGKKRTGVSNSQTSAVGDGQSQTSELNSHEQIDNDGTAQREKDQNGKNDRNFTVYIGRGGGGRGIKNPNSPPGCFSAEMTVKTKFGTKRMDELQIGDEVLIATSHQIEMYQPVEWFFHRNEHIENTFVIISTASNKTLSLTKNHLVSLVPCFPKRINLADLAGYVNHDSVFAFKAKPSLCLATKSEGWFESDVIVDVVTRSSSQYQYHTKRGVYSPVTSQGTIIVNSIQSLCYSTVENHFLQYNLHMCLMRLRNLVNRLLNVFHLKSKISNVQLEVPSVLLFMLDVAKLIVPSLIYV